MRRYGLLRYFSIFLVALVLAGCGKAVNRQQTVKYNPLKEYASQKDPTYRYELHKVVRGKGYKTHVLRMVSGQWLSKQEVRQPEWWHWLYIVVPDSLEHATALLFIGGGNRDEKEPGDADGLITTLARKTKSVAMYLHNVPNQPVDFVNDDEGGRVEDHLIAFCWRQFLEAGAQKANVEWLPRLPMTRAAVRAMDTAQEYLKKKLAFQLDHFVVAGGSKRGWTTWATAIADNRVVAIAPIVIDMLNLVPSFQHHWRAYGQWSAAVEDYVNEGIMEWIGSEEFDRLLQMVDPYSYRQMLTLPKMLINAADDEFFVSDSWQFYWNDLVGEKHIRYVPNTGHSLKGTDAGETLIAFFNSIVTNTPRPKFDWKVQNGEILIETDPASPPQEVRLWSAVNAKARDFRINVVGKAWTSRMIPISPDGKYHLKAEAPPEGWKAFMGEVTFKGPAGTPFKMTTGVVVVPDELPYPPYQSPTPKGTRIER